MRRLLLLGVLFLACDVGQAAAPLPQDAAPVAEAPPDNTIVLPPITIVTPRQPRRVLIVGDSEACAVRPYAQQVADQLSKENGWPHDDVHVSCKGGTVVSYWGMYGHFYQALKEYPHPDDVLIFLGTNHYWQKAAPDVSVIKSEIDNLIAANHPVNCVWVGNTAVHNQHWAINGLIHDAVTPWCSYFDTEAANIPLWDGVHPDRTGAVKWLRLVWPTIPPKYEEADQ